MQAEKTSQMKYKLYLILIFLTTISCVSQESLKDFYYPISDKIETKVYEYIDKNDSTNVEYWKVTTNPKTNEINTVSYNSEFNIYNKFDELITDTGAKLTAYSDFEFNEKGKWIEIKAVVVDHDVYKWNGDKEYVYSVKYNNKYGQFEFSKKRIELGFEKITVSGKEYQTIKFKGEYSINAIDQNDKYWFYQYSYYAKNIGMVKYKRYIPNKVIELELTNILTEKEFNELLKKTKR